MVFGCLLLLALSMFCAVCLRRYAQETDAVVLALASLGMANCVLVLGGALLLPLLNPTKVLAVLAALVIVGTAVVSRGRRWPALQPRSDQGWLTLAGLPGMLLTGFFALFIMSVSFGIDDGFFLHISNIGMISAGQYPPLNFLGEPLRGHFGKDLLTSLLAVCLDIHFLQMEWISTCVLQVLHFTFLLHWLRVEGGSAAYGLLGAYFAFFGSAFGSHLGLVDTVANNNAVAFSTLTLCSYLLLRWWRLGSWGCAALAGIVLGLDALVYEIHFGILGLALFTFTVARPSRYRGFLLLVAVAIGLACVEGGAITDLARKAVSAQTQRQDAKAWQSQNVDITFPKDRPFTLRRDNLRPSRFFETKLRPTGASFEPSREVVPAWSPSILACFWYPVWLAPLVLVVLIKQRNWLAGWFFALGTYSALTPCLVGFGYYEGETARWLFGTAVGLSTAFALTIARATQSPKPGRYLALSVMAWAIAFHLPVVIKESNEMLAALRSPGSQLVDGSPGIPPSGSLLPDPMLNLAHHLNFGADKWQILTELSKRSENVSDRYLLNYPDEQPIQDVELTPGGVLNRIGLEVGLSGRLPAGLTVAPANRWCAPLFSQTLEARAFWANPKLWRLHHLDASWVVVDDSSSHAAVLSALDGVEKVYSSGQVSLWRVSNPSTSSTGHRPLKGLSAADGQFTALKPRQPFLLTCLAQSEQAGEHELEFRYSVLPTKELANPDDLLLDRVTVPAGKAMVELHLIGPSFPGHYKLEWKETTARDWATLVDDISFTNPK
jgi:hypothetical protein